MFSRPSTVTCLGPPTSQTSPPQYDVASWKAQRYVSRAAMFSRSFTAKALPKSSVEYWTEREPVCAANITSSSSPTFLKLNLTRLQSRHRPPRFANNWRLWGRPRFCTQKTGTSRGSNYRNGCKSRYCRFSDSRWNTRHGIASRSCVSFNSTSKFSEKKSPSFPKNTASRRHSSLKPSLSISSLDLLWRFCLANSSCLRFLSEPSAATSTTKRQLLRSSSCPYLPLVSRTGRPFTPESKQNKSQLASTRSLSPPSNPLPTSSLASPAPPSSLGAAFLAHPTSRRCR
mmetsp:Transcript_19521/g.46612  ORF Transcript_19521/g.46612 Transcript_19521/m.46612 type:complete len:286 (-) Transcript_19521:269-1126(-)